MTHLHTSLPHNIHKLINHELFESMFSPQGKPEHSYPILINFSAKWCGPCQKVDWEFLREEFPTLNIYKCDVDENKYTLGFCGGRSIPAFIMIYGPKQASPLVSMSDTAKIATWIHENLTKNKLKSQ
jgi:thiol-disulfide isomerase/thioredoxin